MKAFYIGAYGGGVIYFVDSLDEAKNRFIKDNPNIKDWKFTLTVPGMGYNFGRPDGPKSAIVALEVTDRIYLSAIGLIDVGTS